jgi:hypothetical protein
MAIAGEVVTESPSESEEERAQAPPPAPSPPPPSRAPAIIVALTIVSIVALCLWYLVRPLPLLIQGEADATRIDIAARVDGRVAQRPADRGQNVTSDHVLVTIDNPELLASLRQAEAANAVAVANLKRIEVGARAEVIAQRRAALATAEANERLAEQTYDRTKRLTLRDFATMQKLDEDTALDEAIARVTLYGSAAQCAPTQLLPSLACRISPATGVPIPIVILFTLFARWPNRACGCQVVRGDTSCSLMGDSFCRSRVSCHPRVELRAMAHGVNIGAWHVAKWRALFRQAASANRPKLTARMDVPSAHTKR